MDHMLKISGKSCGDGNSATLYGFEFYSPGSSLPSTEPNITNDPAQLWRIHRPSPSAPVDQYLHRQAPTTRRNTFGSCCLRPLTYLTLYDCQQPSGTYTTTTFTLRSTLMDDVPSRYDADSSNYHQPSYICQLCSLPWSTIGTLKNGMQRVSGWPE